ncbi:MAG: hypothetical protein ACI83P_000953, partial [Janthinobacterium sp.]
RLVFFVNFFFLQLSSFSTPRRALQPDHFGAASARRRTITKLLPIGKCQSGEIAFAA